MDVSGIEIPELKPEGMEEAIECYALLVMNRGILPKAAEAISAVAFHAISLPEGLGSLTLSHPQWFRTTRPWRTTSSRRS